MASGQEPPRPLKGTITGTCLCHKIIDDVFRQTHGLRSSRDDLSPSQMDTRKPVLPGDEQTGHVQPFLQSKWTGGMDWGQIFINH